MTNETKDQLAYFEKLEADAAILKKVNKKLLEQLDDNYKHCLFGTYPITAS